MPIEARSAEKQTEMQSTMQELQAENSKSGGMLFATFGEGKGMALVFPTPFTIEKNGKPVADALLVITSDGYRLIHFDRKLSGVSVESVSEVVREELGKASSLNHRYGYNNRILALGEFLFISSKKVEVHSPMALPGDRVKIFFNCSLVESTGYSYPVQKLLEVNRKRAGIIPPAAAPQPNRYSRW